MPRDTPKEKNVRDSISEKAQTVCCENAPDDKLDGPFEVDAETNKRLLRKIDLRIMPVVCTVCQRTLSVADAVELCFTYAVQYYDKATLSQAAIFGLRDDLELNDGLKYSWVSLTFYFGYMVGTYPISVLAQRFRTRVVCTVICILWSVVVVCTPTCTSYSGFLANRFFLGILEAGVSPIFMLVVGIWYTHSEQVMRSGWWYSFSGGSLLVSPLINYGLGHITGGSLHPWQYMYLFAGGVTFFWGVALWWLFPDGPQDAKGFTEEERRMLLERIRANNAGVENNHFRFYQVKEALMDYQFWGIMVLSLVTSTGSGVVTTFGSIVFNGMGFNTFVSLLMNLPIGALAFICILGSAYLGRVLPNARFHVLAASCLPVILGCALLYVLPVPPTEISCPSIH